MDKEIVIIGHGEIAKSLCFFPGVLGYVRTDEMNVIRNPLTDGLLGIVDKWRHRGVIGIGKPTYKEERLEQWLSKGYMLGKLIHPSSYVDPRVSIGEGSCVWPFSSIDGKTSIGRGTMIGPHGIIHHSTIEDYCHVTMRCTILPRSKIGSKAFIGSCSTILEGVEIGMGSAISANSSVRKNVGQRVLYFREKLKRPLADEIYYPLTTAEKEELEGT